MAQAPFTAQDAQELIAHAESAPLRNMQHSAYISGILQRAVSHFNEVFNPPGTAEMPEGFPPASSTPG